jgi:uncharacterized protein
MLITPVQLVKEPLVLKETLAAGGIDFGADVTQTGPLYVNGRAELIEEHRGHGETVDDIRLRARMKGAFELPCARCLEPVTQALDASFDLIYRPADVDAIAGEHAITEDETEIGYYEKGGLLLEDAVREQVLLTLPARVLCQEDCQGLSAGDIALRLGVTEPEGGSNRLPDPRWNALAGLDLKTKA